MITEDQYREYEMNNPFMAYNHIEICKADPMGSVVRVKLERESMNLRGYVHGGLLCGMMDVVAGLTARCVGGDYVTQSFHVNYLSNVTGGVIYAKAETVKRGRSMVIIHVDIVDENGKLLADGVVDMFCLSAPEKAADHK